MSTKATAICPICGKEIEGGCEVSDQTELVCIECTEQNYFECEKCETLHPNDESIYISSEGISICGDCTDGYVKCDHCNDYEKEENMHEVGNGQNVCDYCFENNYDTCADCGEVFPNDELHRDYRDDLYCSDCYEDHKPAIEDYHTTRKLVFFGGDKSDNSNLFLGAEIEVDDGDSDDCDDTARDMKKCFETGFINMEHDGSLDEGFENITQPATLEYHTSIKDRYKKAFSIATGNGFKSHKTSSCGLHVHFNRSFYAENEELYTARLLYIVSKFWDNMTIFSRRSMSQLNRWAKKIEDKPEDFVERCKNGHRDRYYAVNLTNRHTIEFRMFRGTLKVGTYIATLQLVDAIVRSAKEMTVEQIQAMEWEQLLQHDEIKEYWDIVKERKVRD